MQIRFRQLCLFLLIIGSLILFLSSGKRSPSKFTRLLFPSNRTTSLFSFDQRSSKTIDNDDHFIPRLNFSDATHQNSNPNSKSLLEDVNFSQGNSHVVSHDELPWWERVNISYCEEYDEEVVYRSPFSGKNSGNSSSAVGHCGYRASRHGDHQKVVSYSLFGHNPAYFYGIPHILEDVMKFYPGWNVRVHTNPELHYQLFCPLLKKYPNLSLCDVKNLPGSVGDVSHIDPMLWRSAPLGDGQVERFIVRDTDSELSGREAAAVAEWEASRKPIHLMRDHQDHSAVVMGGMFGIWQPPKMIEFFEKMRIKLFVRNAADDQDNLRRVMPLKLLQHHSVQHCSFWCSLVGKCSPFPTQRQHGFFVGNANYKAQGRNLTSSVKRCPRACRPSDHGDWLYC